MMPNQDELRLATAIRQLHIVVADFVTEWRKRMTATDDAIAQIGKDMTALQQQTAQNTQALQTVESQLANAISNATGNLTSDQLTLLQNAHTALQGVVAQMASDDATAGSTSPAAPPTATGIAAPQGSATQPLPGLGDQPGLPSPVNPNSPTAPAVVSPETPSAPEGSSSST